MINNLYNWFILWDRRLVIQVFGRESYEYQKLATRYKISGSYEQELQDSYKQNLREQAIAINSIIQTWERLGFETEIKGGS